MKSTKNKKKASHLHLKNVQTIYSKINLACKRESPGDLSNILSNRCDSNSPDSYAVID